MANQIQINVGINSAQFQSGLASMRRYTAEFRDDVRSQITGAIAGFALLTAAVNTLKSAFAKGAEMEGFTAQFKTLLGSVEEAKARMAELAKFAASTPFALPEIAAASRVLETLTNGMMSTGDGLRMVGDAAATAKRPFEEIAVVIGRVYAGIQQGSNTIGAEINRLIELGLVSNQTKIQLQGMMEQGMKGSQVWAVVAADLDRFTGQMEAMSATLEGKISTLGDAWDELLRQFSEPIMETLKAETDRGITALEDMSGAARAFGEEIVKTWNMVLAGLTLIVGTVVSLASAVAGAMNVSIETIKASAGLMKDVLTSNFDGIVDRAKDAGNNIAIAFKAGFNRVAADVKETIDIINDQLAPLPTGKASEAGGPQQATPKTEAEIELDKTERKRQDRLEKIRQREEEAMRDKLEGEAKINALIEERDRLLREAEVTQDDDKAISNLEDAQKIQREIEREQERLESKKEADAKKAAADRKREREEQDRKDRDAVEDIAQAREQEAKARRDEMLERMTPQERIAQFEKEKAALERDAKSMEETDPATAARKRTQAIELGGEIRKEQQTIQDSRKAKEDEARSLMEEEQRKSENAKRAAASVPVSSLQAVGGGGRAGPSSSVDPVLRETQKQSTLQSEMVALLRQLAGQTQQQGASGDGKYL